MNFLNKIYIGTIRHIQGIDNIIDLAIFTVAGGIVLYCVGVVASALTLLIAGLIE